MFLYKNSNLYGTYFNEVWHVINGNIKIICAIFFNKIQALNIIKLCLFS